MSYDLSDPSIRECPFCAETIKVAAKICRFCNRDVGGNIDAPQSNQNALVETTYLSNSDATITNSRAIIHGKTYAMANVTSVVMHVKPPDYSQPIIWLAISALWTICAIYMQSVFGIVLGLLVIFIAGAALFAVKTEYSIRIGSASGESNLLTSQDKAYIATIVAAMNEAIVKRG